MLGSGFPAPARASYPFLSPSAHGGRQARGAQTKARAVGPTGPGPPTLRAAGVLQPRGRGSRCNFANRKEGGAVGRRSGCARGGRHARGPRARARGEGEARPAASAGARNLPAGCGPRPSGPARRRGPHCPRGTTGHPHARTLAHAPCPGRLRGPRRPGGRRPAALLHAPLGPGPGSSAGGDCKTFSSSWRRRRRGRPGLVSRSVGRSNGRVAGPSLNPTPGHRPGPAPIHSRRPRRSRTWPWLMVGPGSRALTWLERRRRRRRPPGAGSARPGSGSGSGSGSRCREEGAAPRASHARAGGGGEGPAGGGPGRSCICMRRARKGLAPRAGGPMARPRRSGRTQREPGLR